MSSNAPLLENRYRLLQELGQGGMSRVYLAEDLRLKTRVAVKENLLPTAQARAQFEREAQLLAALSHPNLPRVMDHFTIAATARQYLVMDYIEGRDLKQMIEQSGPLPEATALAWVRQVLNALEYLHTRTPPIIHRDVKPANIKITAQGKVYLVDLGIAKASDPNLTTHTGARAVTPGYAPPEQYGMRTNERSDIYGLGATLYTMLTGQTPPEAPLRVAGEDRLLPPTRYAKMSNSTERAILRAMELETGKRWQSAAELRAALTGPIAPPSPPRNPNQILPIALGGGVALVLIILTLLIFFSSRQEPTTSVIPSNPTATVTLLALAATATQSSTETLEPTRAPSATTAPTVAAVQVATAIVTETLTATPSLTNTSAPAVPSRTRTVAPTARPPSPVATTEGGLTVSAPTLLDPPDNSSLSRNTILRWSSNHALQANEVFDVLVWPDGTTEQTSIGNTTAKEFGIEFGLWRYQGATGRFLWTIRVRRIGGGYLSAGSSPRSFNVTERAVQPSPAPIDPPPPPPPPTSQPEPTDSPIPTGVPP